MSSNDDSSNRPRRGSFTTQTFTGLFGRTGNAGTPSFPAPISTAAAQEHSRRRLSMTGVGLSATSPTQAYAPFNRRGSVSTAGSDSIDESAIEDADGTAPATPFGRRMSFGAQALRTVRTGSSPGNEDGFNWSDQFRSRAESSVSAPQRPQPKQSSERTDTGNELRVPPSAMPRAVPKPVQQERPKPDAIGERILRGQFMMD